MVFLKNFVNIESSVVIEISLYFAKTDIKNVHEIKHLTIVFHFDIYVFNF